MKPQDAELEIVRQARALWRTGSCTSGFARDAWGRIVPMLSSEARSFCIVGALYRVLGASALNADKIPAVVARALDLGAVQTNDHRGRVRAEEVWDELEKRTLLRATG